MNFSDIFKQTSQLCAFSPDSRYLANAVHHRVVIRDAKTLQVTQVHSCLDAIQYIEWSPDSQFILCGMYKRSLVQVDRVTWIYLNSSIHGVSWLP